MLYIVVILNGILARTLVGLDLYKKAQFPPSVPVFLSSPRINLYTLLYEYNLSPSFYFKRSSDSPPRLY